MPSGESLHSEGKPTSPAPQASGEDQALVQNLRKRLANRRWLQERNWWG